MKNFPIVFDKVILKQFKKAGKNKFIQNILSHIFDKIEELGPRAGKLLDSKLHIYEIKLKRPPIRLYYKYNIQTNEIYVFEYQMKTSSKKQNSLIRRLKSQIFS